MHKHSLWGDILDAVACVGGHEINVDVVAQFVHIDRKHCRLVRRHGALEASGHAATRHRELGRWIAPRKLRFVCCFKAPYWAVHK